MDSAGPSNHNTMSYSMLHHGINSTSNTFMNQGGSGFDFGELEDAIAFQALNDTKPTLYTNTTEAASGVAGASSRAATATLEMFPSWPIRFEQVTQGSSKCGGSSDSESALNTISSSKTETQLESESPMSSGRKTQEMETDKAGTSSQATIDKVKKLSKESSFWMSKC